MARKGQGTQVQEAPQWTCCLPFEDTPLNCDQQSDCPWPTGSPPHNTQDSACSSLPKYVQQAVGSCPQSSQHWQASHTMWLDIHTWFQKAGSARSGQQATSSAVFPAPEVLKSAPGETWGIWVTPPPGALQPLSTPGLPGRHSSERPHLPTTAGTSDGSNCASSSHPGLSLLCWEAPAAHGAGNGVVLQPSNAPAVSGGQAERDWEAPEGSGTALNLLRPGQSGLNSTPMNPHELPELCDPACASVHGTPGRMPWVQALLPGALTPGRLNLCAAPQVGSATKPPSVNLYFSLKKLKKKKKGSNVRPKQQNSGENPGQGLAGSDTQRPGARQHAR